MKKTIAIIYFIVCFGIVSAQPTMQISSKHFDIGSSKCDDYPKWLWDDLLWLDAYSNLPFPFPQEVFGMGHFGYPRTLRGYVAFFTEGWKYDLTLGATNSNNWCASTWTKYQDDWNKIMAIKVSKFDGTENSIRLGFRYIPGGSSYFPESEDAFPPESYGKFELGFYGHLNHLQSPWASDRIGREFVGFGVYVDPFSPEYFELKLDERDFYARASDVGVLIHRKIFNGSDFGYEQSHFNIEAFYGTGQKDKDYWRSTNNLDFYGLNLVGDDDSDLYTEMTTPILKIMNSVFYNGESKTYHTRDLLLAPVKSSGGNNSIAIKTGYEDDIDGKFTIIEYGADITFTSEHEISLLPGFTAQSGCEFNAKIENCFGCKKLNKIDPTSKLSKEEMKVLISQNTDTISTLKKNKLLINESLIDRPSPNSSAIINKIYPNPAQNQIVFSSEHFETGTINIQSTLGTIILTEFYKGNEQVINISTLPNGLYVLVFTNQNNKSQNFKFIKN